MDLFEEDEHHPLVLNIMFQTSVYNNSFGAHLLYGYVWVKP